MYFRRKTQEMCEKHFHRDQILNNWIFKLNNWIFKWNVKYVTWDIQCVKIGSQFVESTKYFLCIFYYFLRFYNAFNLFSDVPSKRCSLVFYLDLIEGWCTSVLDPLIALRSSWINILIIRTSHPKLNDRMHASFQVFFSPNWVEFEPRSCRTLNSKALTLPFS